MGMKCGCKLNLLHRKETRKLETETRYVMWGMCVGNMHICTYMHRISMGGNRKNGNIAFL